MLTSTRVQEKGQINLPGDIRRKLKLKKGDLVTFTIKGNGVVIQSLSAAIDEILEKLNKTLEQRAIPLNDLLSACQKNGNEQAVKEFGLNKTEASDLFTILQLQAQKAVESIRSSAEQSGTSQLSDEEITAEIEAVRNESTHSHRS